jgi:hypothetical protein
MIQRSDDTGMVRGELLLGKCECMLGGVGGLGVFSALEEPDPS